MVKTWCKITDQIHGAYHACGLTWFGVVHQGSIASRQSGAGFRDFATRVTRLKIFLAWDLSCALVYGSDPFCIVVCHGGCEWMALRQRGKQPFRCFKAWDANLGSEWEWHLLSRGDGGMRGG